MADLQFRAWRRTAGLEAGTMDRASRVEKLTFTGGGQSQEAEVRFEIPGPGDVSARGSAIVRYFPTNGSSAVEAGLCAHVEFIDADFAWRYAPFADLPLSWLALVVGVEDRDLSLITTDRGPAVHFLQPELEAHAQQSSKLGAHVQYQLDNNIVAGSPLGRLVSTSPLPENSECVAALVPAFPTSENTASGIRPAYLTWRFQTGDGESFRSIASRLRLHRSADLGKACLTLPDGFGRSVMLESALRTIPENVDAHQAGNENEDDSACGEPDVATGARIEGLTAPTPQAGNARPVVGLPIYTDPWGIPTSATFAAQLLSDPRDRAVAGLGALDAIEDQAHLVRAMLAQAGHIGLARKRIGAMAAGVESSGWLWRVRLPADPLERLSILGPALRGLVQEGGVDVSSAISGASTFPTTLFSSAARRAARRRRRSGRAMAVGDLLRRGAELGDELDLDPIGDKIDLRDSPPEIAEWLAEREDVDAPHRPPLGPARLPALANELSGLFDPTGATSPQRSRVLATITGLEHDDEPDQLPDACESLDLPAWRYLAERHREFLLFGGGQIPPDSVVPLEVNDRFVDAYLVGINAQLLEELRFRNVAVAAGCTPIRRFWSRIHGANSVDPSPHDDIRELRGWPHDSELGALSHEPPDPLLGDVVSKDELVVLFRTSLFQRYPDTLVSLRKSGSSDRVLPAFGGALASDIQFFGFDIKAWELDQYDVILEDPPHGIRFRSAEQSGILADCASPQADLNRSDAWAATHLDRPIQVVIAGPYLEQA